jgi:hypothetical protein
MNSSLINQAILGAARDEQVRRHRLRRRRFPR